jgi:hypothetical protein
VIDRDAKLSLTLVRSAGTLMAWLRCREVSEIQNLGRIIIAQRPSYASHTPEPEIQQISGTPSIGGGHPDRVVCGCLAGSLVGVSSHDLDGVQLGILAYTRLIRHHYRLVVNPVDAATAESLNFVPDLMEIDAAKIPQLRGDDLWALRELVVLHDALEPPKPFNPMWTRAHRNDRPERSHRPLPPIPEVLPADWGIFA